MDIKTVDDELIAMCAFRYALGRRTYVVDVVTKWLMSQSNDLSKHFIDKIIKEIDVAILNDGAGDKRIDVPLWEKLALHLRGVAGGRA